MIVLYKYEHTNKEIDIMWNLFVGIIVFIWLASSWGNDDSKKKTVKVQTIHEQIDGKLFSKCRMDIRNSAIYPAEVDFDWLSSTDKTYPNFNTSSSYPHRYHYTTTGEMMNGLGMMVPFRASCKYDYNNTGGNYKVEVIIL